MKLEIHSGDTQIGSWAEVLDERGKVLFSTKASCRRDARTRAAEWAADELYPDEILLADTDLVRA